MDTLTDNRIFPKEMQQHMESPSPQKKNKNTFLILLFAILLVGIAYLIFFWSQKQPEVPVEETFEEQQEAVVGLEESAPNLTRAEREEKINTFLEGFN